MNFDEFVLDHFLNDLDDAEEQRNEPSREFHSRKNSFDLSDLKFIKYFRLNKDLARQVIELVTPFVQQGARASALSVETKVLIALKFFASGSYQEITGTNIYTAVSQAAVSRAIHEIADALGRPEIMNRFVRFPQNLQELAALRNRFFTKYAFPGIVGIIDCTHIAIVRPPRNDPENPEHIYVNRKQYHSINVQLICDDNLKILNVNARYPGSTHDAFIWSNSLVSETLQQIYRQDNENNFFLLGDSGYTLRPWLLTPIENAGPNTPEERFNTVFKRIRCTIERCNGCLKNRFRCLLKHRVLHYKPLVARRIIQACIVLHNLCIEHNIPEPEEDDEIQNADFGLYQVPPLADNVVHGRVNPDLAAGRHLQRRIIAAHFNQQ